MSPLIKDLLLQGILAGTAVRSAKKKTVGAAYYAAAAAFAVLAIVFFAIAGYGLLLDSFTMPVAASLTGLSVLFVAIVIGFIGHYGAHNKKAIKKPAMDGNFVDSIEGTIKSLMGGFEEPIKDNPKMALLMAALAGFAAGDQLSDRIH